VRFKLATFLADAVSRLAAWLPDRFRDGLADRAGAVWIRLTPVYRANVVANLRQVVGPQATASDLDAMARLIFRMSARNFGELLRVRHLSSARLAALLPISVRELSVFREARARGQGVVIVTAHLGAFDLIGHAVAAQGVPLTVITGRTTKRFIFDAVSHLRRNHNINLVEPTPSGVRRVIQALRNGEIAGFLADYDFFRNGSPVTFFGRETTLPPGPIRIARDTGALVVPIFTYRSSRGHEIEVGEPFTVPKSGDVNADVARGMAVLTSRLEAGIAPRPNQWVLFQRAWPEPGATAARAVPAASLREGESV
jgi:KDO2-lipid IV(A) lauroyltransferase